MAFWAQGFWKPGFWKDNFWSGMNSSTTPTLPVNHGGGGGTGIDYQVPRAPYAMPNKDAEKFATVAQLEYMYNRLTGNTASKKMQFEAMKIVSPYELSDEINFVALEHDKEASSHLKAVFDRYSEKRKELFAKLRANDYDWEE